MSLLGMPLLIINMGGEMMYILEQRLLAQSITRDKSKRVLQDVVRMMFNKKFVEELFKPQELYSNVSIRGIFDRLAHSSIMRLSESSMDKLFDLMTMGVKYQLVCSTYAAELIDITLNHVEAVRQLVEDPAIESLIDSFLGMFKERYETLPVGEWMELRQTLHRYFQDRRIRVSLFMKEGYQTATGYMVFPKEEEVPPGCEAPGKIRYYSGGDVKVSNFAYNGPAKARTQPIRSKLGINLYSKTTPAVPSDAAPPAAAPVVVPPKELSLPPQAEAPAEFSEIPMPTGKMGAAELNLLAALVNTSKSSDKEVVSLNLFGSDKLGLFEMDKQGDSIPTVTTITLDPTRKTAHIEGLMKDLNVGDAGSGEEKDLLELMDSSS